MVDALGSNVTRFKVGDAVFGQVSLLDRFAEYAAAAETRFAKKPTALSFTEAATISASCTTAHDALFDKGKLQRGERVLIQGGAGGVGPFAIQLAHGAGGHQTRQLSIIASASWRMGVS